MQDIFTYGTFRVSSDRQTAYFDYSLTHQAEQHEFTESLYFPLPLPANANIDRALRALHLALGISYYKIFVPSTIAQPYAMDQAEADFWNTVWRHGLGEFLYVNKLDPASLATFSTQNGQQFGDILKATDSQGALLGIGGGKDSIVAGEMLKRAGIDVNGFVMATGATRGQAQSVAETMNVPLQAVERSLDKRLLEVQELPGAHKGHVPISLIFGLVGVTLAIANNNQYVVVANEASASLPRITWEHGAVNHQWSKSLEFEQALQKLVIETIAPINYFSAVRPMTSVAIAKAFAQFPAYFSVFTSDNSVFRIDPAQRPSTLWSLESPKSLSSFILLAPWLPVDDLLRTFGRDFLDERSLQTLFLELTGQQGEPPLDCVGTVEELVLSLNLAYQQGKYIDSFLMQQALQHGVVQPDHNWQDQLALMLAPQADHALPDRLAGAIEQQIEDILA